MDIADRAQGLTEKIRQHKASIATEEATKNAFVMPFIGSVLGYDVFDPTEVIPEFTADYGTKKGEKIDYAIAHGGQVQVLIEVKKVGEQLRVEHASQLYRYFSVTNARIAILTNGEVYEFYTDLDTPNRMDTKPYLVLNLSDIDETALRELTKLTKESFDLDSVISAAGELKYIGQIKRILATQFKEPDEDWVRFLTARVYDGGSITQRVREQFLPLVEKAGRQFLNDQVKGRLNSVLDGPDYASGAAESAEQTVPNPDEAEIADPAESTSDVVTTEEEIEAYRIVRAIVCSEVAAARVIARDNKSYFGVLLDDNNRKPVARLWFNRSKKYLGLFDEGKNETRIPIDGVEDIYQYADQLRKTVSRYLNGSTVSDIVVVEVLQT